MENETRRRLDELASDVRDHFDSIAQDVPNDAFLVGGAVRDVLLDREPNDFDFVVVGETSESMLERGFEPIEASSFPVFHDSEHEEWALARTEQNTGSGYDGFEVFTDDVSLKEDLKRRDLTINAMALDPSNDTLVDPFDGVDYIEHGILSHVSHAFAEDPLRVLRTARYAARFSDFVVHDQTLDLMRELAPQLNLMSRDRIGDEITTAMAQAEQPARFWEVLLECGALAVLWPDLHRAQLVPAGHRRYHAEGDVFTHTMMVVDRMHELCEERGIEGKDRVRRLLAAVAHDIGKVYLADRKGGLHSDDPPMRFGGHDRYGKSMIKDVERRLGLRGEMGCVMQDACEMHMDVHDMPHMAPQELLDNYMDHLGPSGTDETLPLGDERDTGERVPVSYYNMTLWELVDLAHADHEGRLQPELESNIELTDDGWSFEVTDEEQFEEDGPFTLSEHSVERPVFEREPFEQAIEALQMAQDVNGYDALRNGLCDDHSDVDDEETAGIMHRCESCRSPDEWVSEILDDLRRERVREVLDAGGDD